MNRFLFFSRGQQIGIIILLILIATVITLNAFLPEIFPTDNDENDSTFRHEVADFEQSLRDKPKPVWQSPFEARHREKSEEEQKIVLHPFDFDPNTLDSAEFVRLGLPKNVVQRILKFRNNEKRFFTADFFVEFCHLNEEQSDLLLPHVQIVAEQKSKMDSVPAQPKKTYVHIELNAADTTLLKQMPGIGSGRARQIVGYRKKLGGFVRVEQLLEIRNFPPDVFEKIKPYLSVNQMLVKKITVNKASVERLKNHPYLDFYKAKAIYEFRREKRQLQSIDELKKLNEFKNYDFEKIAPYLDFSEVKYEYKRK